jgi:hypothetical protein
MKLYGIMSQVKQQTRLILILILMPEEEKQNLEEV